MNRLLVSAVILSVSATWICASEIGQDDNTTGQEERVRTLVGLLASKNAALKKLNAIEFPGTYDKQAQAVVYLAMMQLLQEGSAAFDVLIDNSEDEHYCYSYIALDGMHDVTVGRACNLIMYRMVHCYGMEIDLITRDQYEIYEIESLKEWWQKKRERPLWEIQKEVLDEAIVFFEKVDRETASSIHIYAEPLSNEEFEAGRNKNLRVLREIRAVILAKKEAYVPKSLDGYLGVIQGLPWPTRVVGK